LPSGEYAVSPTTVTPLAIERAPTGVATGVGAGVPDPAGETVGLTEGVGVTDTVGAAEPVGAGVGTGTTMTLPELEPPEPATTTICELSAELTTDWGWPLSVSADVCASDTESGAHPDASFGQTWSTSASTYWYVPSAPRCSQPSAAVLTAIGLGAAAGEIAATPLPPGVGPAGTSP
jgi:hypothetical protein